MSAPNPPFSSATNPIIWDNDELVLLDQRLLPAQTAYLRCRDAVAVAAAIRDMVVRGAPAIGITAAYGVALAARSAFAVAPADWRARMRPDLEALRTSRPTAVNLAWALDAMERTLAALGTGDPWPALVAAASALHAADRAANLRMGELGAACLGSDAGVLTHCNAGALATSGHGTALGVIRSAHAAGRLAQVYATETRPWLQGARLTAWELLQDNIAVTLLADSAAAWLMQNGRVQWLITGADRIAANGDTVNKIGTYALATLARAHGVRFMVVAPLSTIDLSAADGAGIPLEERAAEELTHFRGSPVAAAGVGVLNPVFDLTPAALVDCLVTENGVVWQPQTKTIRALFEG